MRSKYQLPDSVLFILVKQFLHPQMSDRLETLKTKLDFVTTSYQGKAYQRYLCSLGIKRRMRTALHRPNASQSVRKSQQSSETGSEEELLLNTKASWDRPYV